MSQTCHTCGGVGAFISKKDQCSPCGGQGKVKEKLTVSVNIPAGVNTGSRIRLSGKGNSPLQGSGPSGDMFIQLEVIQRIIFCTLKLYLSFLFLDR